MLRHEEGRARAIHEIEPGDVEGTRVERIVRAILSLADEGKGVDYPTVFSVLEIDEDRDLLTRIAFREEPQGGIEELVDCVRSLRRQRLMRERRELQRQIQTAVDPGAIDTLLNRTQRLAQQIDALT
jgi:hypothetical protein